MRIPIACSLSESAARSQLGEWHTLLESSVVATDRPCPSELSLRLRPDLAQLESIVRLAQREKACCPFFDFAIAIEAEAIALRVSVPPDAVSLLDGFGRPHA